ncbi:MAG: hypothetical protein WCH09_05460 [Bacteroidota bacterium]
MSLSGYQAFTPLSLSGLQNINVNTINGQIVGLVVSTVCSFSPAVLPTLNYTSSTGALVLNLPYSSAGQSGILQNADWTTFNAKVTSVTQVAGANPLEINITDPKNPIFNWYWDPLILGLNQVTPTSPWQLTIPNLKIARDNFLFSNNFMGFNTGTGATGTDTIVIGRESLQASNTGSGNIIIGSLAGNQLSTGNNNVSVGHLGLSGGTVTTGFSNTLCGNYNWSALSPINMNNVNILGNSNVPNHSNCNIVGSLITTTIANSSYMGNVRNESNLMALSYNSATKEITQEPKFVVIDINNANYNFDTIAKVLAMLDGVIVSSTALTASRTITLPTQALLISAFGPNLSGLNFNVSNTRQTNAFGITFRNPVSTASVHYGICLNLNNLFVSNAAVLLSTFFYYSVSMDWNTAITGTNSTGAFDQNVMYMFSQIGKRQ